MEFIKIILTSVGSIIALFFSTKIIGNKQMSELSMFDYINGITIGSIAAEMATSWFISYLTEKNIKLRRFFTGRSIVLMQSGKIYQKNFKTSKIDINDFLVQCRINGFFTLDDVDTAILEQNGKISFLPKVQARPVNVQDMNITAKQEKLSFTVVLDGHIMEENLKFSGNNKKWLENELQKQKIGNVKDVFIALCDGNNTVMRSYYERRRAIIGRTLTTVGAIIGRTLTMYRRSLVAH